MSLTWKKSRDMCKQGVCKYHAVDMDGSYCTHPESIKRSYCGLSTNRMSLEGLCTGCYDDPEKNKRQLFEPYEKVKDQTYEL